MAPLEDTRFFRRNMKLASRLGLSLVALSLAALATLPAHAQSVNGTFGFVPLGRVTYTGASLDMATSVTVPALEIVNTLDGPTYLGSPNQFNSGPFSLALGQPVFLKGFPGPTTLLVSTDPILFGSPFLTFLAGGETFDYTVTQVTSFVGTSTPPGASLAFDTLGVLTSSGTTNQIAQLSGSFTQTGPGTAVNGSFTFSTPVPVPEPGSVALLVGIGISGSVFVRGRKQVVKSA